MVIKVTTEKAIRMIDEYLTEPHSVNREWVECLRLCRQALERQTPKKPDTKTTNNRMTDNEIIKALECCLSSNDLIACWKCPAVKLDICCDGSSKISNGIVNMVINLINRKQAEVEHAKSEILKKFVERLEKGRPGDLIVISFGAVRSIAKELMGESGEKQP